jgi:hypothetical protein
MTVHTGVIEAISHKYDKFAILYNGNWFNTKKEYAEEWPVMPAVGDEISWDDGGKKYLGKMKIVKKNVAPSGASAPPSGGYSSIGVEIGHASKLAMDMALATSMQVASKEFYKFWAEETLKVHGMMTKLKAKASAPAVAPASTEEEEVTVITAKKPEPEPERPDAEIDDIF